MMETTRDEMRKSPEFKENLTQLIDKRFFYEVPNSYYAILEILVKDQSNKALEEKIKSEIENNTVAGKVAIEKILKEGTTDRYDNLVKLHIYDQEEELENISVSPMEEDIVTDYKTDMETFTELSKLAIDYEFKKAEISSDLEGKTY
ncbi:MAG: hypothetical protein RBS01_00825 [Candidatus Dojkabacteria bacterium]|jgi:hypothetical protein|nr:hypothetical protein [Candidatus Dojkabacteria bacterium]